MKSRQEVQIRSYGDQLFTSPYNNNCNANEEQVWGQKDPFTFLQCLYCYWMNLFSWLYIFVALLAETVDESKMETMRSSVYVLQF